MKINCIDKEIKDILETGYYIIPRFQRPYLWDRENVEEFWNDAVADTEGAHFIGSIVVYKAKEGKLGIVDGQQRLTTITMIICALRNALNQHALNDLACGIHHLVERPDIANRNQFVLQTETSYPFLQEYIQKYGIPKTEPPTRQEESLLRIAFDYITSNIEDTILSITSDPSIPQKNQQTLIQKKLEQIRDRILRLKLIFVEVDQEDDAYIIFETLNTRGKDLRLSDLVKNHITRLLKPKNVNVDIPKEKWNTMVSLIEQSSADISVDTFLHHLWLSKYEYTTAKKLFKGLKRHVTKANVKKFLEEICRDAGTYREIVETSYCQWENQEISIKQSLDALNVFHVKQDMPMILSLMRDYRAGLLKKKYLEKALSAIENFHFMFTAITSQRSSGGISLMYAMHSRQLSAGPTLNAKLNTINELIKKLREKKPSFKEFEANFMEKLYSRKYPKDKRLVQYILGRIYRYHDKSGVPIDYSQMTIEHLAPENADITSGKQIPDLAIAQIGNLILVDNELNKKLSNKAFTEKKPILEQSSVWLDRHIKKATEWGKKEIEKRTSYLAKIAYEKVWHL
jgi:uncharacterized protein with ParB-like and HNH nuclease domain